jgi:hypothetical protein
MRAIVGLAAAIAAAGCGGAVEPTVEEPSGGEEHVGVNPMHQRGGERPVEQGGPAAGGADLATPLACPVQPGAMGFGPITWPAGSADARWMVAETHVASVQSSIDVPVEVCGVGGELAWLLSLECPDGSKPYPSSQVAHASRIGSVGAGGRCGTIIDLYAVPCPDATYEVYMDMYQCMPGESWM